MLKVSDNFKKSCNSDNLKYREFIIIDNKEIDIKGNLSATAYKDTTFFGKFNLKMLTFETENDIDYKGKEFVYYKEVDGEPAKIGTFIVTEVKDSDTFENVNVTAYDYGLNFANPYKSALDYKSNKITMLQIAQEICTNCGVELENASLPNGNFIVDSNQFINGEQFGDVVCLIALENGMFATINENNKLEFIFKKETVGIVSRLSTEDSKNLLTEDDNYIVVSNLDTIDDYVDLDDKRDTRPITCVLVATSKDLEEAGAIRKDQNLIKKHGENWLKIYDYAFAYSSEKCEQLVDAIFNQVKGFGYSSFETNYSFKPYLQLGDEIKFRNKKGDLVKSIILRIESNYDEIKLSAPSIINASVEYDLPETEEELVKGAIISVNKANAEIVMKVTGDGKLAQVRLDGNASDGSIVEIQADNINMKGVVTAINNGTTTIDGDKITTGTITANQVSSDIITTTNFSAQNINASKITSGTLSTDRLESKVITTNNFSAQNINADKITAGTLSAANVSLKNVSLTPTSSKIGGWTINASQLLSANSTGNSTINSNGEIYFYPTKGGILALNNAFRCKAPSGIAIYNDKPNYGASDTINAGISIMGDSGNVTIGNRSSAYGVNIRSYISSSTVADMTNGGLLLAAANDIKLHSNNNNIYMDAINGAIWAHGNSLSNSKVKTDAGSSSSRNVKTNFKKFNQDKYDKALSLLNKMNLYDYDYKYNIYKNPHQYGFIIDELEQLEETKDFFEFEEYNATIKDDKIDFSGAMEGEHLKTKNYDSDVLDKYLLTCIKALLNKVEVLENKINEMEESKC